MANLIDCLNLPLIGVGGNCGYTGASNYTLEYIGVSLRKAANVSDDERTGAEMLQRMERAAAQKVINQIKLKLSQQIKFTPIYDTVKKQWTGDKDICRTFAKNTPIGLRIEGTCRDDFKKQRLNWIELYVDNDFTVEAIIEDGENQIPIILEFKKGLNRKEINYTFESQNGSFWMRLCNGAVAYENPGCGCTDNGFCGCSKCADVYSMEVVEGGDIECEDITEEWLEENGYESEEEYLLSKGYQDTLEDGTKFLEPECVASNFNLFGYEIDCICSYDWLFCKFKEELAYPILIDMGMQIYEQAEFTPRFNEWVDSAHSQADYYLNKWNGINPLTGKRQGEYEEALNLVTDAMKSFIDNYGTDCLPCRKNFIIQTSIP